MASTPDTIPVLESFRKFGDDMYMRDPEKEDGSNEPAEPTVTIVVLFWMGASTRNAAKYLAEYVRMAPQARIIFILTSPTQIFLHMSKRSWRTRIIVAEAIRSSVSRNIPLYFHTFSNGGAFTLESLASYYRHKEGKPLPAKALLIDSAPGHTSVSRAHKALSYSFPKFFVFRILSSILTWAGLLLARLYGKLRGIKPPSQRAVEALNDTSLIDIGAKKCYLYSETDELIPWKDVEEHAAEAKQRGWEVSWEKFIGSAHVSHMRTDPKRYWEIVSKYLAMTLA